MNASLIYRQYGRKDGNKVENEITIGSVGISVLLMVVLRVIYGAFEIDNRYKAILSCFIGIALSLAALYVTVPTVSAADIAAYIVQGFMCGATATGLYEMTKGRSL